MKKYMLFGFDHYYPRGGMNDLIGTFDSKEEADDHFIKLNREGEYIIKYDEYQLFDTEKEEILGYTLPDFNSIKLTERDADDPKFQEYKTELDSLINAHIKGVISEFEMSDKIKELRERLNI
ncbi:hypothetical protein ABNX05_11240 [Lysinibacillus sp. M3]|uniref:Uncharacterized protein n=1 Tax=Lysinibacillus zambalensis TaxID=3160866 RepID=A0ABV1MRQ0_9BACI